ncbi:MAG TPA: membrane protein insertion efficiency factor YidD [Polyangiaceae bacterium]|nr:membrane protein insertion efficiency factor YidD [Polyangiaceae bacterium]
MIARYVLIPLIRLYRKVISPLLGPVCRFEPSCSSYAQSCVETHGALRGSLLSAVRLCKCHPFHPGGYDPPPLPRAPRREHPTTA